MTGLSHLGVSSLISYFIAVLPSRAGRLSARDAGCWYRAPRASAAI